MSDKFEWRVSDEEAGERIDVGLGRRAGVSRAAARRLVEEGRARLNGRRAKKGQLLAAGDRVTVEGALPTPEGLRPVAEPSLPLVVLYEDADLVAVAKPAGLATHPLEAGERGTLAGALVARYPECATAGDDPREAGFAHRLDRETSGVLLAARSPSVWHALRDAFRRGAVEKRYLALAVGRVAEGACDWPLAHDTRDRRRVVARDPLTAGDDARPALTRWRPLATVEAEGRGPLTLLAVETETGRMHQVRAHLAHAGHPLVGDTLYDGPPPLDDAPGHFLHAERVALTHPTTHARLVVTAPLPDDRERALRRLGLSTTNS